MFVNIPGETEIRKPRSYKRNAEQEARDTIQEDEVRPNKNKRDTHTSE